MRNRVSALLACFAVAGSLATGLAVASSPPPAVGQIVGMGGVSGSAVSATQSQVAVSWSVRDDPGGNTYARPCAVFVNTVASTPDGSTPQFAVGENDTSWQGTVNVPPGSTVYVGLSLSMAPLGVDVHDCSHPSYTGVSPVAVPAWLDPAPAPAPSPVVTTVATTTAVAPVVTDPSVDARLTALEQHQQVQDARIATLESKVGAILGEPKNVAPFTAPV